MLIFLPENRPTNLKLFTTCGIFRPYLLEKFIFTLRIVGGILQFFSFFFYLYVISNNVAFLTRADSDEPVQPPFKLRNSKLFSVSRLTLIEYSND